MRSSCAGAPRGGVFAGRVVLPWALQRSEMAGDVLEIGCGSGAMAAEVLRQFSAVRLTATDYDGSMVQVARERLSEFGSRAEVRQADANSEVVLRDSRDGWGTVLATRSTRDFGLSRSRGCYTDDATPTANQATPAIVANLETMERAPQEPDLELVEERGTDDRP